MKNKKGAMKSKSIIWAVEHRHNGEWCVCDLARTREQARIWAAVDRAFCNKSRISFDSVRVVKYQRAD